MNAKIYAINQVTDEKIKICGIFESSNESSLPTFFLQERIPIDDYIIPERIYLEVQWDEYEFEFLANFAQIVENSKRHMIWDCFFSIGNMVEKLTFDIVHNGYSKEYTNIDFIINMYQTKIKTLAFSTKGRPKQVENLELKVINDVIVGKFELDSLLILKADKLSIITKKRIQNDILYHSD
ncbi:hypothetical protein AB685_08115 [Bacillus sp. LL01]|uniref:hypothetical protein n=1 Tax=Bacillus sp. LL01 TaxID=1665556 RepID=UPI00064D6E26|nr:hypothetical protein [Bacillus sp. LL01]KMJ59027.1 hypothetical protein AB685_08115 [Bacillus sp. LL01]